MPKLLIDSPSAFKLGLFSEDNITSSENAKNVRKWLNALNVFRSAIGQFGFEIYSMSSCCLCFVFTCFDLLLSLLFHSQSHGYAHSLEKKKLEFAIGTSPIIHLFCPPKCFVFSPRSIGTPLMPRRYQMIQRLCIFTMLLKDCSMGKIQKMSGLVQVSSSCSHLHCK